MSVVLGIDQGSTHTRAAVCDFEGNIRSVCSTFGACHSVHGMVRAMAGVREAAETALRQADASRGAVAVLFAGLTGADWPDEYELLRENVLALEFSDNVHVTNDCIVAWRGGTSVSYGAILTAGTGGNCAIRSPQGEEFIYHYYHDYDLQGAIALGRRALKAIYRAETGREPPTLLRALVIHTLGFATVDDLLRADVERGLTDDRIKAVAPSVFTAADAGDQVASEIITAFGAGMAELVTCGLQRYGMTGSPVEVVLSGSLFKASERLVDIVRTNTVAVAPMAEIVNARYEPVVGSLLLGLEELGIEVRGAVETNIEESSKQFDLVRCSR